MPPTGPQLVHAIRRNFGGLEDKKVDPERVFRDGLAGNIDEPPDPTNIPPKVTHRICYILMLLYSKPFRFGNL